jgi:hypothetical protein
MSRADTVKTILILEAFADEARRRAAEHRELLNEQALAELDQQGTAPTWRLPDIAQVTLPLSKQKVEVVDADQLRAWVEARQPEEVETVSTTRVRPAFVGALLEFLVVADGVVMHPETGEVVPGLKVRKGGEPGSIRITPDRGVRAFVASTAAEMLGTAQAALNGPVLDAEPGAAATFSPGGDPFTLFPPAENPFAAHPPIGEAS